MVIVVASIKGGTGKTTLATNLAVLRAQNGADVLLVDADSQRSSSDFISVREEEGHDPQITSSIIIGKNISDEVRKFEPKFDDIIIDVGGRDSITLRSALLSADVLIVPCLPSQLDAWALEHMDNVVSEVLEFNSTLRAQVVLNKVDTNPKMNFTKEVEDLAKECKSLVFSNIKVYYRIAFRRAVAEGVCVTELKPKKDPKAIEEINKLYNEVFKDA